MVEDLGNDEINIGATHPDIATPRSESEQLFPDLQTLDQRHPGVTTVVAAFYAEAAAVCLSRHHRSPVEMMVSADGSALRQYSVHWTPVDGRQLRAWANDIDATCNGAYGIALGAAEAYLGLVAIHRAPTGTGSDYYLGPLGSNVNSADQKLDLENALRLEVSGIDQDDERNTQTLARLRQKVRQAQQGDSDLPAIAGIVAFNMLRVSFRKAS